MKISKKILLTCILVVFLIINTLPLFSYATEETLTVEKISSLESFNIFDCENADIAMGFFPAASTSTTFSYSETEGTFNQGARSIKVSSTGNASVHDEIASMHWQMFQREGYANTSDWSGGEYISLWVKNASSNAVNITYIDFYEGTFGPLTPKEVWRLSGAYYTLNNGNYIKNNGNGSITVPANYNGKIIIPIGSFSVPSWYTSGDGILNLFRIVRADIGFVSLTGQSFLGTLYIDSFCVLGEDVLQVDTLDAGSLEEMQLYGFESVDYELPTLSFDSKLADKNFVKTTFESEGAYLGKSSLALENILENQANGQNQYGGFGVSLYNQGENDGVDGKDYGNWTGAEYVGFWINNTNTSDIFFSIQCYENAPAGQPFQTTKCYQLSGFPGSTQTVNYYTTNWHLVSENKTVTTLSQNKFYIPAGFKGKVYIPLNIANFEIPSWQTGYQQPTQLKLDRMAKINIIFLPVNNSSMGVDKIYFDNLFIAGKDLSELEIKDNSIFGNANAKFTLLGDMLPNGVYSSDLITQFSVLDEFDEDSIAGQALCEKLGYEFLTSYKFSIFDKTISPVVFKKMLTASLIKPANLGEKTKMFLFKDGKFSEISYTTNDNGTITANFDKFGVFVFANVAVSNIKNPSSGDFILAYFLTAILLSIFSATIILRKTREM